MKLREYINSYFIGTSIEDFLVESNCLMKIVAIKNKYIIPKGIYSLGNKIGKIKPISRKIKNKFSMYLSDDVCMINNNAFRDSRLVSINIPDSIYTISKNSFYNCSFLEKIEFEGGKLNYIGEKAFANCISLKKVDLSKATKLTKINSNTFSGCKELVQVILPKSVTTLDVYSFSDCINLEKINLENVKEIGLLAFYGCYKLDKEKQKEIDTKIKVISLNKN